MPLEHWLVIIANIEPNDAYYQFVEILTGDNK